MKAEGLAMIKRTEYLDQLLSFREKRLIKVVTGIRHCGKSALLDSYREELLKSGVEESQIISVNFRGRRI
jgi:predicted AAA+ superfamily ATPase